MPQPRASGSYLGIDPGKQGGIVFLSGNSVQWHLMPATELDLWNLLKGLSNKPALCCIERVNSLPGEGHQGAFTFGEGYGRIKMAVVAAGIRLEIVNARVWQKEFAIPGRKPKEPKAKLKERCRATAQHLFPGMSLWHANRTLGKQRAICDALLLAEYARRCSTGSLRKGKDE